MALRFNGLSPTGANPFSAMCTSQIGFTAGAVGTTANLTTQWGRGERHSVKTSFGELASNPPATESPVAWTLADKGGDLAAENSVNQSNTLALTSLALGKALDASLTQDGSITAAALSMIAALSADMQNDGQLTGPLQMTLNMAANLAQEGQITASLGLIAWMQASLTQDADMSASNLRGTLSMAASIVSYTDFTAEGVRDAVWNAILANYPNAGSAGLALSSAGSAGDPWITTLPGAYAAGSAGDIIGNMLTDMGARAVDGTYTQDEVMRLLASVIAGKISGAGTGTETFRDLADTKDRVVATVDANGNRTAITRDAT